MLFNFLMSVRFLCTSFIRQLKCITRLFSLREYNYVLEIVYWFRIHLCGMEFVFQVTDVKKSIETAQGAEVYPASQQMLIHQGKVLKDGTTLEENKVVENSFIVIMLSKVKFSRWQFGVMKWICSGSMFRDVLQL